jgi:hypothetical protein
MNNLSGACMKPKVFVASSVEGLDVAYHVQTNLQYDADCTVWPQGVFELSQSPLDSLIKQLEGSDFAIFVFTADDEVKMRGDKVNTVRDNVLFELGLFIGRLGKQRCYIIIPDKPKMHISSDLIGLTPATYSGDRDASEIAAALGPACHAIRTAIKKIGPLSETIPLPRIPANERDNYNDDDKVILLKDWLNSAMGRTAYKFEKIDDELELERGSTKRLLHAAINKSGLFKISEESQYFFELKDISGGYF